jgi:hypothetical protein
VYYPSSRWHYTFDNAAIYFPDSAFVAPDGVTIIPETYDIGRCAALFPAVPGSKIYESVEIQKRTLVMDVDSRGILSNQKLFCPRGETTNAVDKEGNIYIAEGQIFVFDRSGKEMRRINLEERPLSMTFGGTDGNTLFVTTETSLYSVRIR